MKLNGTIKKRGTIEWSEERGLFVWRGFELEGTDPSLIEMQGDDSKLFAFENCTFNRKGRR